MSGCRYDFNGRELGLPLISSGGFHNYNYSVGLGLHSHKRGPEITYLMKGFAEWELTSGDVLEQPGNTLAFMPKDVEHRGGGEVITPCWLYWYVLDLSDMETACKNTPFDAAFMSDIFDTFSSLKASVVPALLGVNKHFSRLLELLRKKNRDNCDVIEMRLALCQIILSSFKSISNTQDKNKASVALCAREFMKKKLDSPISVDDIAAACGLSESQFARRFKKETGMTPADYLQRLRIEEALQLFSNKDMSITEIAFKLGFSSSQYFSTVFKRYIGTSPYSYRINHSSLANALK